MSKEMSTSSLDALSPFHSQLTWYLVRSSLKFYTKGNSYNYGFLHAYCHKQLTKSTSESFNVLK